MSTHNLHKLFNPKSIAVIGASEKKGSVGFLIMKNLLKNNFAGGIFPVNPEYDSIMGLPCFTNVEEIRSKIDIAVIATPIQYAPETVKSCGIAGLAGVVIISARNKKTMAKTRVIENKILNNAKKYNLRIIGPSCFGIVNTSKKLNASFTSISPLPGDIAFISQSGTVCTSVLDFANHKKIGFSHIVSLGSSLDSVGDVDFADMIDYSGSLSSVKSIVMYIENITNMRNFMSAARSVSRVKPIIVLKPGMSKDRTTTATSVTDALVNEDAVYDAAFQRAGILRVNGFEELLDCSEFIAKTGQAVGPGLTIITNEEGQGLIALDALVTHGMTPSILNDETIEKLNKTLPESWRQKNNVIILKNTTPKIFTAVTKICANARETDALLLICSQSETMDTFLFAKSLTACLETLSCPAFTAWTGKNNIKEIRQYFNQAGIVTYDSAKRAVMAFKNLCQYRRSIETIKEIPVRTDKKLIINRIKAENIIRAATESGKKTLTAIQAKNLLHSYGIPVNKTKKTDSGKESVKTMQTEADYELIIGAKTDPSFGPVILFGMGGALTEVVRDISIGLPPLNRLLTRQMIEKTKISKVLKGYNNIKQINISLLEELLIRISRLVTDFPQIIALDINPLMVKNGSITALDAEVHISDHGLLPSPKHLIISSYPWQYEKKEYTATRAEFFIRPIRPSDADLLINHFQSLSQKSVYLRFFSPVKRLSKSMLIQLTQIDYDREIALVALKGKAKNKKIIGVCRIILGLDKNIGEYAMAISDEWQGKGIGTSLLKQCLRAAQSKGVRRVMGIVLSENTHMLKLGKKLGFSINRLPESREYELIIDFNNMNID